MRSHARSSTRSLTRAEQEALAATRRAEEEARYRDLYGDHMDDVRVLRQRDFVVTRDGVGFRVGNKLLSGADVAAMAARERALSNPGVNGEVKAPAVTSAGLKIGDVVAIAPPSRRPSPPSPRRLTGAAHTARQKAIDEHSTDLGARPKVVWLDLALLVVDQRYQREVNVRHVNRIVRAFNWNCYQPIVVCEREDGTYAVIDGQHRLEAAKKHPLVDALPCYIIDAPDVQRQAAIFVAVNSVRRGLSSWQKFNGARAAGDPSAGVLADRQINEAHGDSPGAFRAPLIAALTRLAAEPGYSRDRVGGALAATTLERLLGDMVAAAKGSNGNFATAAESVLRRAMA